MRVRGHGLQVAGFFSGCEITHMRWMTHRDTGAFRGCAPFRLQPPKPFPTSSTAAVGIPPWHGTNTPLRAHVCGSLRRACEPSLRLFSDAVIDAIQRHVDAKRYLCAARPEYHDALSEDSQRSLKLQGGIFSKAEADKFISEPGAPDAVRLRLWDDLAKQPALQTPGLSHYMQIARRCALKA